MNMGSFSAGQGLRDTAGVSAFGEVPLANNAKATGTLPCFNEAGSLMSTQGRLLFRGLRIKAGIEIGGIKTDIDPLTGQMAYRGRAMNRAARIAGMTKTGMVWCSSAAWSAAHSTALRLTLAKYMSPHPEGVDEVTISGNYFTEIANSKDETFFSLLNDASNTCGVASSGEPTQMADQARSGSAQAQSDAVDVEEAAQAKSGSAQAQRDAVQAAQAQSGSAQVQIELVEVKEAQGKAEEVKEAQPKVRSDDPAANDHVSVNSSISSEAAGEGQPTMEDTQEKASGRVSTNPNVSSKASGNSITLTLCHPMMEESSQKAMSCTTNNYGSADAHGSRENLPFNELCTIGEISGEFSQLLAYPNRPRNQPPRSSLAPRTTQVGVLGHTRFLTGYSQASLSQGSRVPPHLDVSHIPLGSFALKGIEDMHPNALKVSSRGLEKMAL
eukprot:gene9226-16371_t